jgi:hypothetical protein
VLIPHPDQGLGALEYRSIRFELEVALGLARIGALCDRAPTLYQVH